MTARKSIAENSTEPLFTFDFAAPGASGMVLIDGKTIQTFKYKQHVLVRAQVSAGDHMFNLRLAESASLTFMVSSDDFKYCRK